MVNLNCYTQTFKLHLHLQNLWNPMYMCLPYKGMIQNMPPKSKSTPGVHKWFKCWTIAELNCTNWHSVIPSRI